MSETIPTGPIPPDLSLFPGICDGARIWTQEEEKLLRTFDLTEDDFLDNLSRSVFGGLHESIAPWHALGVRPLCPCCGGGQWRKGKRYCKAKSRCKSAKARATRNLSRETIRYGLLSREAADKALREGEEYADLVAAFLEES